MAGPPLPAAAVKWPAAADEAGMNTVKGLLTKRANDEAGGEVLEYALIAGLIVVAAIAVIGSVGTKVLATAPHRFFGESRGWVAASDLQLGEVLRGHAGPTPG
jgi:Flp pilus assembly pilin Flp